MIWGKCEEDTKETSGWCVSLPDTLGNTSGLHNGQKDLQYGRLRLVSSRFYVDCMYDPIVCLFTGIVVKRQYF